MNFSGGGNNGSLFPNQSLMGSCKITQKITMVFNRLDKVYSSGLPTGIDNICASHTSNRPGVFNV